MNQLVSIVSKPIETCTQAPECAFAPWTSIVAYVVFRMRALTQNNFIVCPCSVLQQVILNKFVSAVDPSINDLHLKIM